MFLYFAFVIIVSILSFYASKNNNIYFYSFSAILVILFSGLRSKSVGVDTTAYYDMFYSLLNGRYVVIKDPGFGYISKILMGVFDKPEMLIFIYAMITNALIFSRLWDFKNISNLGFMVLIYLSFYFNASMNIMRQTLAISLIFFGTRYLEKNKYIIYLVFVIVAASIHFSAIVGTIMLVVWLLLNHKFSKKNRILLLLLIVPITLLIYYAYDVRFSDYEHYFSNASFSFSWMIVYKIILVSFITFFIYQYKDRFSLTSYGTHISINYYCYVSYILGLLLTILGINFSYMDRVALPLLLFEIPLWGQVFNIRLSRSFMRLLMGVAITYSFVSTILNNGQGILPYTTIFSE